MQPSQNPTKSSHEKHRNSRVCDASEKRVKAKKRALLDYGRNTWKIAKKTKALKYYIKQRIAIIKGEKLR